MMPDQKGRSGKKPKYQIPDIGGADQTAEDISTERVLNFLIKGEALSPEQTDGSVAAAADINNSAPASAPPQTDQNKPSGESPAQNSPAPRKSLARLFERAKSGGTVTKEAPLQLPPDEQAETPSRPPAHPKTVQTDEDISQTSPPPSVPEKVAIGGIESPPLSPETTAPPSPEFAQHIELWKSFYRLNAGEVDALSALYRLSHEQGSDECYIKMRNLAEMSNLTYRYCQKVVRSLEQLGWITKLRDYDPYDQLGVLYRINLKPSSPLS